MSKGAKVEAYSKIENLVKNIGYPDFVFDDNQLTQFYKELNFTNNNCYVSIVDGFKRFGYVTTWQALALSGAVNRTDFAGPPGITNAWYQPQLNSITFPQGILQQPFFDVDWPTSVNYGGLGIIAGHELTHGFDDEGVQWNGVGELRQWLDPISQKGFQRMADCVIQEYNGFCPLDNSTFDPSCINGANTQGENIADNGGLVAAYRAYKNVVNFKGPDATLPGSLVGQFSHDQLFFLSFAQVWCEPGTLNPVDEYFQLLLDPHSPSKYRILGSLQNFPGFRDAFNCPTGKAYAPEQHCNVWVDEVKSVTGIPPTTTTLPSLNIPENQRSKQAKYEEAATYFANSVDVRQDPCNSFYEYTCGKFQQPMYFESAQFSSIEETGQVLRDALTAANDPDNQQPTDPNDPSYYNIFVETTRFYNNCINALPHWQQITKDDWIVKEELDAFEWYSDMPFPLVADDSEVEYHWPDAETLGVALGYLRGVVGVDSIISSFVDTNWGDPQSRQPYAMFIDQPSLLLPQNYYMGEVWKLIKDEYIGDVASILGRIVWIWSRMHRMKASWMRLWQSSSLSTLSPFNSCHQITKEEILADSTIPLNSGTSMITPNSSTSLNMFGLRWSMVHGVLRRSSFLIPTINWWSLNYRK